MAGSVPWQVALPTTGATRAPQDELEHLVAEAARPPPPAAVGRRRTHVIENTTLVRAPIKSYVASPARLPIPDSPIRTSSCATTSSSSYSRLPECWTLPGGGCRNSAPDMQVDSQWLRTTEASGQPRSIEVVMFVTTTGGRCRFHVSGITAAGMAGRQDRHPGSLVRKLPCCV